MEQRIRGESLRDNKLNKEMNECVSCMKITSTILLLAEITVQNMCDRDNVEAKQISRSKEKHKDIDKKET